MFGKDHNIVTMDSNNLKDGWRDRITKQNPNTKYRWENLDGDVRDYEEDDVDIEENVVLEDCPGEEEGHFDEETDKIDAPEYPNLTGRDLPKRVVGFSSVKMLKLFGKHLKSSLEIWTLTDCLSTQESTSICDESPRLGEILRLAWPGVKSSCHGSSCE